MGKTYIGVGDTAQQSKKIYLGVNDVAKKVKKAYVGVNGVAQEVFYAGGVPSTFTDSQLITTEIPYSLFGASSKVGNYALFANYNFDNSSTNTKYTEQISAVDADTFVVTNLDSPTRLYHYMNRGKSLPDYAVFGTSYANVSYSGINNPHDCFHTYDKNLVYQEVYYGSDLSSYYYPIEFNDSIVQSYNGKVLILNNDLTTQETNGVHVYAKEAASNTEYVVFLTSNTSSYAYSSVMSKDLVCNYLNTNSGKNYSKRPVNTSSQAIFVLSYSTDNSINTEKQRVRINAYSRNLTETMTEDLLNEYVYAQAVYSDDKGYIFGSINSYAIYCVDEKLTLSDAGTTTIANINSNQQRAEIVNEKLLVPHANHKLEILS